MAEKKVTKKKVVKKVAKAAPKAKPVKKAVKAVLKTVKAALKAKAVAGRAMGAFAKIRDGLAFAFVPPAVIDISSQPTTKESRHEESQRFTNREKRSYCICR